MPATEDREQPLVEHLRELRQCLLRAMAGAALAFLALVPFARDLYHLIAIPLLESLPSGGHMIATEVASPFFAPFKLSFFAAVFCSAPWILHQAWRFISPALYRKERKTGMILLCSSILLFYAGCLFAYFAVLPLVFSFFASMAPEGVHLMTDIQHYLNFVITLFFAFGVAFQIPVLTWTLVRGGFLSVATLEKNRPWIFLSSFVFGMLLTPPDVISQILLAIPAWLLFEAGLFLSKK